MIDDREGITDFGFSIDLVLDEITSLGLFIWITVGFTGIEGNFNFGTITFVFVLFTILAGFGVSEIVIDCVVGRSMEELIVFKLASSRTVFSGLTLIFFSCLKFMVLECVGLMIMKCWIYKRLIKITNLDYDRKL